MQKNKKKFGNNKQGRAGLAGHPKYWLSGAAAKRFRREVSLTAGGRQDKVTLSHKFSLAAEQPDEQAREKLRNEYYLSAAIAENTLFHLFTALHLSGFRLFPNKADAEIYLNTNTIKQSDLSKKLEEWFDLPNQQTEGLLKELAKDIRASNQNQESVTEKLRMSLGPKKESGLDSFIQEIAREIANKELWSATSEDKKGRREAITKAAKELKCDSLTLPTLCEYHFPLLWCGEQKFYLEKADYSAKNLEFAMHQMVALAAHTVRKTKETITSNDIKEFLLSDNTNYNGISWLFNTDEDKGIYILAKEQEKIEKEGCSKENLENIQKIAQSLLNTNCNNYQKCRSLFGGNIASGISNYWNRLKLLEQGIKGITIKETDVPDIKEILTDLEKEEIFKGIISEYKEVALPVEQLQKLIEDLIKEKAKASDALGKLMGRGKEIAGKEEVETIEKFNELYEEIKGLYAQLAEKLRVKNGDKKKDYSFAKGKFPEFNFLLPKYWNRLKLSEQRIKGITIKETDVPDIKEILTDLEKEEIFKGIISEYKEVALPVEQLQKLIEDLIKEKAKASDALGKLMGRGKEIAGKEEVETIEKFNELYEEIKGLYAQLAEKLRVKNGDKKKDYSFAKGKFPKFNFLLPKGSQDEELEDTGSFLKLKINRYRGAQVFNQQKINEELEEKTNDLRKYQQMRKEHWQKIKTATAFDINNIIAAHTTVEETRLNNDLKKKSTNYDTTELACRKILHTLAKSVCRLGDANLYAEGMKLFQEYSVFKNDAESDDFFKNNKGCLYKSPFSSYNHEPYKLGAPYQKNISQATIAFIEKFFQWIEQIQDKAADNIKLWRDAAQLENTKYGILCRSVRKNVSTADAESQDKTLMQNLSTSLTLMLKREKTISAGELAKLFNQMYASKISGLCATLTRKEIIVKYRLQHIDDKNLYYLPKGNKDWTLPEHMFDKKGNVSGNSALAHGWKILQEDASLFADKQKKSISAENLPKVIEKLDDTLRKEKDGEQKFRTCLRQIPHDWYYKNSDYPVLKRKIEDKFPRQEDEKNNLIGLWQLEKGKILKKQASACYLRLTGTSSHKGWLDDMLLDKASLGCSSLIIEEEYEQKYQNNKVTAHYHKTRLEIAVVFNYKSKPVAENAFSPATAKHFIAIDLGERGIGYAVYQIPEQGNAGQLAEPIKQGHVVIPILRRLMRRVDTYRRREQPRQRFQSNLNTALQQMREATIGEVTGIIDGLIKKHRAFPVFESSVSGFESGGRQLKMVYGSILQRYIFSDVDAHKAKRKDHWQASNTPTWKHEILKSLDKDNKPLNMFPGVAVHPAGTSQTCSYCGLNPLDVIEAVEDDEVKSDAEGIITLKQGQKQDKTVRMYIYDEKDKENETENAFPTRRGVAKNTSILKKDLEARIKKMLRHPPLSSQSKDTSQSSYLSPFVDTQKALAKLSDDELKKQHCFRRNGLVFMHADINAAVNIGKKWWNKINQKNNSGKRKNNSGKR